MLSLPFRRLRQASQKIQPQCNHNIIAPAMKGVNKLQ